MSRLHRLLDDGEQRLAQLLQVHLMAQGGAEGSQRLGRIILAAREAPINNLLISLLSYHILVSHLLRIRALDC